MIFSLYFILLCFFKGNNVIGIIYFITILHNDQRVQLSM